MQIFSETPVSFRFPCFLRQSVAELLFRWTENEANKIPTFLEFVESVID